MKTKFPAWVVAALVCCGGAMCQAQDAKSVEKDLNSELRNAQSCFFNGKFDESATRLQKAGELLESLKKLDPAHKQLESLERKLDKQKTDLEKKLAKGATAGTGKGTTDQAKTPRSPSVPAKGLPRKTRLLIPEFERTANSLEKFEAGRMQRLKDGQDGERVDSILKEIQEKVEKLPVLFDGIMTAAKEEGVAEHPDILSLKERFDTVHAWGKREITDTRAKIAGAKAGQAAAEKDATALSAAYEDAREKFFDPIGNSRHEQALEKIAGAFALIEKFAAAKPSLTSLIAGFEEKYGRSRQEIEKSTGDMKYVHIWEDLKRGMEEVAGVPALLDVKLKERIKSELEELPTRHDFFRLEKHAEIRKMEALRRKHVPAFADYANLEQSLTEDGRVFDAKIDKKTWPEPKGSNKERAAVSKYFNETWGKDPKYNYTVLGTRITGDWSVQKRDITGNPTMYGLPVLLAVQKPEDQAKGLARVFILTALTAESANATMTPPFTADAVGDSCFLRANRIK